MADDAPVSIIIPCYNYGRFLGDTLASVLDQTYVNWECIVVNDGSEDNTAEVASKFAEMDSRIIYIYQQNKGVAEARNTALRHSKGRYIQLLDADDMIEKNKLELQVALLEENKNIDLVYSDILIFNNSDQERNLRRLILNKAKPISGKNEAIINSLMLDNLFLPGCVIFRREVIDEVGYFADGMSGLEDWNYFTRIALHGFEIHHDDREGTHLMSRDHDHNSSKVFLKMLRARINARAHIIDTILELKKLHKFKALSPSYVEELIRQHKALLAKDKVTYNLLFDSFFHGVKAIFSHAYYSRRYYFAFYDGAHYIKERIKQRKLKKQKV